MAPQTTISDVLIHSLEDQRLDKDEKYEIAALLETLSVDEKRYLRNQAFDLVQSRIQSGVEPLILFRWLERIIKLVDKSYSADMVTSRVHFSPGDECRDAIIRLLHGAKKRVDICVFTISDNRITEAIKAAHDRGIGVRIISDNDKANDRGSDIYHLGQQGVPVCLDISSSHMHHKFALVDKQLINGSFNWTRSATEYNQENIVITDHPDLLPRFDATFNDLWRRFSQ
ncbi:MAG: phospholipase D-like domain-containing protein [Cellvibrionaceae bacterium]